MTARIASSYSVGSRMNALLEVRLESGFDVRRDFEAIARVVESAARSRVRDWEREHFDVQVSIVVLADQLGTPDDKNMMFNAVCKGIKIIPGGSVTWQVVGG